MAGPPLGMILRNLRTLSDRRHAARSDAELLARFVAERDETAFEVLVWRHGGLVYQVTRRLLGREADVEDAFQATFLILARDAARIGQRGSLAGWLYRVAYRVALRLRQRRRSFEPLPIDLIGPHLEPADECAHREQCRLLLDEIARLPECYRLAVVLCCLEGKTNLQAASELGCPCGTVDSRLAWARRRLRERLIRRGVAPAVAGALSLGIAWEARAAPAQLAASTVPLAPVFASSGEDALAGIVSRQTLTLLRGVHPMFSLSKAKLVIASLLLAGFIGIGAGGRQEARVAAEEQPLPRASSGRAPLQEGDWRLLATWKVGEGPVTGLVFALDGKGLATSTGDGKTKQGEIVFRDVQTGKIIWQWNVNPEVKSVAFSPDGKRLASVEGPGLGIVRDVPSGKQLAALKGDLEVIGYSPNGDIYVGTRKGHVIVSADMLSEIPSNMPQDGEAVGSVAFSPDGRRIAISKDGLLIVEDLVSSKIVWQFQDKPGLRGVAFSADGKIVVAADNERVILLDQASGKLVRQVEIPNAAKRVPAVSADGRLVAISDDVAIHLVDLSTGRVIARLTSPKRRILHLAFSPDGRTLAAGDESGTVTVWVRSTQPASTKPAVSGDRLDQLVEQLAKSGRSNEQCAEAVFLTMLGRLPQETELRLSSERLAKAADRKEALLDVVWALQNSREFKAQLDTLQKRRAQLPIP